MDKFTDPPPPDNKIPLIYSILLLMLGWLLGLVTREVVDVFLRIGG